MMRGSLPMLGIPCSVCWQPADELRFYSGFRVIEHEAEIPHCYIPNPPAATVNARTHCYRGHRYASGNLGWRSDGPYCLACKREDVERYQAKQVAS